MDTKAESRYEVAWQKRQLATADYLVELERTIEEGNANRTITAKERVDLVQTALERYDEKCLPAILQWQNDLGISTELDIIRWRRDMAVI